MLRSDGFMGKEGKATAGGYSEQMVFESHFVVTCTGKVTWILKNLYNEEKTM